MRNIFILFAAVLLMSSCSKKNDPDTIDYVEDSLSLYTNGLDTFGIEKYSINSQIDEVVTGKKGASFIFKKNCFLDLSGKPVKGNVDVELREYNQMEDFFLSGLTTTSDGDMLISGGSYYLNATQKGQPLQIDTVVGIFASFPASSRDREMKFFTGEKSGNGINWKLSDQEEERIVFPSRNGDMKDFSNYESARELLTKIDAEYQKVGKFYVVPGKKNAFQYSVDYVSQLKKYVKVYEDDRNLMKKIEKSKKAWIKYREDLAIAQTKLGEKNERDKKKKEEAELKSAVQEQGVEYYNYKLNRLGWYNCDKYPSQQLISFSGKINQSEEKGKGYTQVHLLSKEEMIHLVYYSRDGSYNFNFLPDKPFTIVAVKGKDQFGSISVAGVQDQQTVPDVEIRKLSIDDILAVIKKEI